MSNQPEQSNAIDQTKHTYVTLTFDSPLTDEEVKQMQLQHRAIDAAYTVDQQTFRPDWYYIDNDFTSRHAMDAQHGPLVNVARYCLARTSGYVLDLGCGNGVLLGKICRDRTDLIPCGIDLNGVAIDHARQLFPQFAKNFEQKDIFDPLLWSYNRHYALAILMAGRLQKDDILGKSTGLLNCLRANCDRLMLYVYPSWSGDSLEKIAGEFGLQFEYSIAGVAGFVEVSSPAIIL